MTGNIAIDVAIGLVFIYSLYSLLTTTVVEFIAVNLQLRAKNLKRAIRRMLDDENAPVFSESFNNAPVIKYLSSNRFSFIFKANKYPSYMNAGTFSQALLYLFKENSPQSPSTIDTIRTELEKYKDTETGKYLLFLLNEANGSIEKFTSSVEKWFEDTMERSTGWYKKNVAFITIGFAFVVATLFNVDTLKMVNKLSKDPNARDQYVKMSSQLLSNPAFVNITPAFDTTLRNRLMADSNLLAKAGNNKEILQKLVADSVYTNINYAQQKLLHRMDTLYVISQKTQSIFSYNRTKRPFWLFDSWTNFLGCLLTTIAISLGAPFWFDLLNKLVKLRSSIAAPATNLAKSAGSNKK